MDDFLTRLKAHDWALEPRTPWHDPEKVPLALAAAWRGEPRAHDALMDALANDHAGVWYPVLLPAMPFLDAILSHGPDAGARAVLLLLDDFVWSFEVDPASPCLDRQRDLAFREALASIGHSVAAIAASDSGNAAHAAELVELIDARRRGERDASHE